MLQYPATFLLIGCLLGISPISTLAQAEEASSDATLRFFDGSDVTGKIVEWKDQQISVVNGQFTEDLQLKTDGLDSIQLPRLGKIPEAAAKATHSATVTLKPRFNQTEGDTLRGALGQINDEAITLHTTYAGTLKIKRSLIANLDINSTTSIYTPPHTPSEWQQHGDKLSWIFSNNDLIGGKGNGTIARDFNLPDTCHLGFDIDWKANMDLNISLFSNDVKNQYPNQCYTLTIRNNYAYMRKTSTDGNNNAMDGAKPIHEFIKNGNTAKMDIYMDRAKGHFYLYIDGVEASQFNDPQPDKKKMGGAIHLTANQSSKIRLRNFSVFPWNASLPNANQSAAKTDPSKKGQQIVLQNGDTVVGTIDKIEEEILTIQSEFGKIAIPVLAMRTVLLKDTKPDAPKMAKNDIKAHFRSGGWVILGLESIKDGKLTGFHQGFGTQSFDLSAFSYIDFNLNSEQQSSSRTEQDW